MDKIKLLKIAIIISFLSITSSGGSTLTLQSIFWIIINFVVSFLDLWCLECSFTEIISNLKGFSIAFLVIISIYTIFKERKKIVIGSLVIQFFYIFLTFNKIDIKNWYYTVPTTIYLILSAFLIYKIFFQKRKISN